MVQGVPKNHQTMQVFIMVYTLLNAVFTFWLLVVTGINV